MKIRILIPMIIAVAILVGGPFSYAPLCVNDAREGMVCYCCSGLGMGCTMISCSGCGGAHGGAIVDRWSPEMLPESFQWGTLLTSVCCGNDSFPLPEITYLEVPDKPPNTL